MQPTHELDLTFFIAVTRARRQLDPKLKPEAAPKIYLQPGANGILSVLAPGAGDLPSILEIARKLATDTAATTINITAIDPFYSEDYGLILADKFYTIREVNIIDKNPTNFSFTIEFNQRRITIKINLVAAQLGEFIKKNTQLRFDVAYLENPTTQPCIDSPLIREHRDLLHYLPYIRLRLKEDSYVLATTHFGCEMWQLLAIFNAHKYYSHYGSWLNALLTFLPIPFAGLGLLSFKYCQIQMSKNPS